MVAPPRPSTVAGAVVVAGAIPAAMSADAPPAFAVVVFLAGVVLAAGPAAVGRTPREAWRPAGAAGALAGAAVVVGALASVASILGGVPLGLLPLAAGLVGSVMLCALGSVLGGVVGGMMGYGTALASG